MAARSLRRVSMLGAMLFGVAACTPWEVTYLENAVNQASQEEVAERFGSPHSTTGSNASESEWIYRYRGSPIGPMGGFDTGDDSCREYVLTFDQQGTLRNWKRQQC
ncbi:MAG: hypothetical protein EPO61_11245 [Nitrospirae bacterium]|nr:MAG: hypothetical protein EPO61_11245 [Nitrospirota bacterium]